MRLSAASSADLNPAEIRPQSEGKTANKCSAYVGTLFETIPGDYRVDRIPRVCEPVVKINVCIIVFMSSVLIQKENTDIKQQILGLVMYDVLQTVAAHMLDCVLTPVDHRQH